MLVSYEWLTEYIDLEGITPEDIAEELNRTGIEVEVIYTRDTGVTSVIVGEILAIQPHPEADRLQICSVNVGGLEPLQIVCGAENVAEGQLVPVALEGAILPDEVRIKRTKLRGVESQGMICSAQELGLPDKVLMKEQQEGILVLDQDAVVGRDINQYLGMDDQVIELQLTPNRSDCLSMLGVAYEISAIFDRPFHFPQQENFEAFEKQLPVDIVIESEEDSPFYASQVVHQLQIGPSPQWMQNRLISAGIRPINNIVDITNYVMIETGQPLHAFDYEKVDQGQIGVRRALAGEKIVTLDGVTRACGEDTLLIANDNQVLGLAGIMGGQASEVDASTTTVLLEAAIFDPACIRRTSRQLGLRTDASNRFEKGVDPERIMLALSRAVRLLIEIADGQVASDVHFVRIGDVDDVTIPLRHDRLVNLLGLQISSKEVLAILERLGFPTYFDEEADVYHVQVPSRRQDVTIEVDLIEEIARLYGYDRIPVTLPWAQLIPSQLSEEQELRQIIRHTLRDIGLHEAITYSLTSSQRLREISSLTPDSEAIRLSMPMSKEHAYLRTSLLPHLVQTAIYNKHHGSEDIGLFELGKTYLTDEKPLTQLPEERWELAFLLTGNIQLSGWNQPAVNGGDFFVGKGILEKLFTRIGVGQVEVQPVEPEGFHPGRTAELILAEESLGLIGQLHPELARQYDLGETLLCQIKLAPLLRARSSIQFQKIPRYPAVTRDLALVVGDEVQAGEIEAGIREVAGELLEKVSLFDVFTGEQVELGQKSMAYSLVYRAGDRTLTEEEVSTIHQGVIDHLEMTMGAKLRQ